MSRIQDSGYRIQDAEGKIDGITPLNPPLSRGEVKGGIMHRASCIMHLDNKGFSLIEIIMIIIVVSIAIPALLILVGGEAGRGVEPELRITATNVGQQLLDEIMTKCWDETATTAANCGGTVSYSDLQSDSGDSDDIDDYASGVPAVSVGGISYSRRVEVCYVSDSNLNTPCDSLGSGNTLGSNGTSYKRIAVTVTAPSTNWGSSVVLTTLVTNY